MYEGLLPEKKSSTAIASNNQREDIFISERIINKNLLPKNTKNQMITLETEYMSKNQERNEFIFDFFNQLRLTPENYLNESKKYKLSELIQTVIDNNSGGNKCHLIKNPFWNIFLEEIVNKENGDKDEIMSKLIEESRFRNFFKQLYIIETNENDPKEAVWFLLKENKKLALKEFFGNKIDYLIISSQLNNEKHNIIVYFLFLRRKKYITSV